MLDSYNIAIQFLQEKCGKLKCGITPKGYNLLQGCREKEREAIIEAHTLYTYNKPSEDNLRLFRVHLLVTQYKYSSAIENELKTALIEAGCNIEDYEI